MKERPNNSIKGNKLSRRSFLGGAAVGALGMVGLSELKNYIEYNPNKPQSLYEFSVDNFWYTKVDPSLKLINQPMKGNHKADIVIIGGGYTGLSSAYHLTKRFPQKRIVLLEGAYCGYGGSGRNGGHHGPNLNGLLDYAEEVGPELGRKAFDITRYGDQMVKEFATTHGIECEFNEKGQLATAFNEDHMEGLEEYQQQLSYIGIKSNLLEEDELRGVINSPRVVGALNIPYGGRINPAQLVSGMKRLVENMGVKIWEQTLVLKVNPGKTHRIETELGEIAAPDLVLGLNAYAHNLGFFKTGMFPVGAYNLATAPLSKKQLEAIDWQNDRTMHDERLEFDYALMSKDNRIVIGGTRYPYYANDGLSSGNNKAVIRELEESLFTTFPQLKGTPIEYKWGGIVGYTMDGAPSVGVMGDHKNIYYGVGYSGHGVSFAHTAARIMTDLMDGEENDFTDFYLVNRNLPFAGTKSTRYLGFQIYKRFMQ